MNPSEFADTRRAALLVILSAALTLAIAVVMTVLTGNPPPAADARFALPGAEPAAPFTTAILWLELVGTKAEVFQVLGSPAEPAGQALRGKMDLMNTIDYAFMIVYSALNAACFLLVWKLNKTRGTFFFGSTRFFNAGLVLSVLMWGADAFENVPLLRFTTYADPSAIPDSDMLWLTVATNVKWGALFCACLVVGTGYAAYFGARVALVLPLLYALASGPGVVGLLVPGLRGLVEAGANFMALAWLGSMIHAIALFRRKQAG